MIIQRFWLLGLQRIAIVSTLWSCQELGRVE